MIVADKSGLDGKNYIQVLQRHKNLKRSYILSIYLLGCCVRFGFMINLVDHHEWLDIVSAV